MSWPPVDVERRPGNEGRALRGEGESRARLRADRRERAQPRARAVTLSVTDQARRLARAMTWFTLGMKAILALLFLVPWASARRAAVHSVVRSERRLVGLFVVLPVVAVSPVRIFTALDRILGH